mmetsp:Transcript_25362/g.65531  ORF Transcript_25362/g.65531 Transcript_25362/m.65531 type:complete len:211 (-) Transcript_25362:103-735(-)
MFRIVAVCQHPRAELAEHALSRQAAQPYARTRAVCGARVARGGLQQHRAGSWADEVLRKVSPIERYAYLGDVSLEDRAHIGSNLCIGGVLRRILAPACLSQRGDGHAARGPVRCEPGPAPRTFARDEDLLGMSVGREDEILPAQAHRTFVELVRFQHGYVIRAHHVDLARRAAQIGFHLLPRPLLCHVPVKVKVFVDGRANVQCGERREK